MDAIPGFYADNSRLDKLKSNQDQHESLRLLGQEFEAFFINLVLKEMRKAGEVFKSDIFSSQQSEMYQEWTDGQLAQVMATSKGGLGLADVIVRQSTGMLDGKVISKEKPLAQGSHISAERNTHRMQATTLGANNPGNKIFMPAEHELFYKDVWPDIMQAGQELQVDPKILLAQAVLESGWGKKCKDHNLFGIKANNEWAGDKVKVATHEFKDNKYIKLEDDFRAYSSKVESIRDYVDFIKNNPRYKEALAKTANPKEYISSLAESGYATDPDYADKVYAIYLQLKNLEVNA